MADWLKTATRIAVCAVMLAGAVAIIAKLASVFGGLSVGDLWTLVGQGVGKGRAVVRHYAGESGVWLVTFSFWDFCASVCLLIASVLASTEDCNASILVPSSCT